MASLSFDPKAKGITKEIFSAHPGLLAEMSDKGVLAIQVKLKRPEYQSLEGLSEYWQAHSETLAADILGTAILGPAVPHALIGQHSPELYLRLKMSVKVLEFLNFEGDEVAQCKEALKEMTTDLAPKAVEVFAFVAYHLLGSDMRSLNGNSLRAFRVLREIPEVEEEDPALWEFLNQYAREEVPRERSRISKLDLSGRHLSELPENFWHLQRLHTLNISTNDFTELPPVLTKMPNLRVIIANGNQLISISEAFAAMPLLTRLDILENPTREVPLSLKKVVWMLPYLARWGADPGEGPSG